MSAALSRPLTQTELVERKLGKFVAFNRKFNTDGNGGPWSLVGREFVRDEIWRPLVGFRLVGPTGSDLCEHCRREVGSIVLDEGVILHMDHSPDCPGVVAKPLIITAVNLPRRSGKTHSILSFALASIFLESNKRYAYIASAEDQADELVETKIRLPLGAHEELAEFYEVVGNKIIVRGKNSWIEILPTSFGSITGRGFTGVLADEARDIPARVAAALMPSIFDCHGVECPRGHGHWQVPAKNSGGAEPPKTCPTCALPLKRWYGRLLMASSSGILEDNDEHDWFAHFIERRIEKPQANVYIFSTDKTINPSVSPEIKDAVSAAFADVAGISDYVAVEVSNRSIRRGEIYVKKADVDAIVDHSLIDEDFGKRHAVGFFDTSKTGDKSSLVILEDDSQEDEAVFFRLVLRHMRVWDPTDRKSCPKGYVDQAVVQPHLERVIPRFSRLQRLKVDTRIMPWAKGLVQSLQRQGFSRVEPFEGNEMENSAMYLELLDLIIQKRLRIPNDAELQREFVALRKIDLPRGGIKVIDAGAGKDGRNRRKGGVHRDRAMSVAGAALVAADLKLSMPESPDLADEIDRELAEELDDDDLMPIGRGLSKGGF